MGWFRKLWKKDGQEPSPKSPGSSSGTGYDWRKSTVRDVVKVEIDKWKELGISSAEAENVGEIFGLKLNPFQLESLTFNFNADLVKRGFNFALTPKEMLGTLVDQEAVNRRRRDASKPSMSALEVSIWREADRLIRRENSLDKHTTIPSKMLEEKVRQICQVAERATSRKGRL